MSPNMFKSPHLHRLERAAGEMNPWLTIIAVGLAVMAIEVWLALAMPSLRALESDMAARSITNVSVSPPL
jgi:hypothetical protein